MYKHSISLFALAVASAAAAPAYAATVADKAAAPLATAAPDAAPEAAPEPEAPTDIIVTGTRTVGMKAADSPAPIQLIGSDMLARTGKPELMQSLAQNLPSIQAQSFGSDLAAHNLALKLRGLSPNHTLVLVNGKRRHGTANLNVSGGPYGGGASPDVSFILSDSIDHVEVLQDGAAAQYGTDAIAGVINLIQKKADHGGSISATAGQYFDQGGRSYTLSGNIGLAPVEDMFLNITAETKFKDYSFRGDIDPRVTGTNATAVGNLAKYTTLSSASNYPFVNRILGDPKIKQTSISYNAGYDLDGFEIYSFGSLGKKIAVAYENYRTPGTVVSATGAALFPQGFSPQEKIEETDFQITGGVKGAVFGTNFDLAASYSRDLVNVFVVNSSNAELYKATGFTPNTFHNGDFVTTMYDTTLDLTHPFDIGLAGDLNVAGGLEYRRETYEIIAGDPASYYGGGAQSFFGYSPNDAGKHTRDNVSEYVDVSVRPLTSWIVDGAARHEHYSDFGDTTVFKLTSRYDFSPVFAVRGTVSTGFRAPTLAESFYSGINVAPGGVSGVLPANSKGAATLGFGGLKPEKSTSFSAGFVFNPAPRLTVTVDAYQTTIRDRIVISSSFYGFRGQYCPASLYNGAGAPTLAGCVTTFSADNFAIYNQPAVFNAVSAALGGTVPADVLVNQVTGTRNTSGSASVQTFVNGVQMRTRGIDFLATYSTDFGSLGRVDWSLNANYNENKVQKIAALPSALYTSAITPAASALISKYDVSQLESTTPKIRATLGAFWKVDRFSVNLRESFYGASSLLVSTQTGTDYIQRITPAFLTDLELSYDVTSALRFSFGATNLTNHYPTKYNDAAVRAPLLAAGNRNYSNTVYPTYSPYGINGGYYYGRVGVKF